MNALALASTLASALSLAIVLDGAEPAPASAGADMVAVPAGAFWMGEDNGPPSSRPRHRVYLDAYAIDRTEVTAAAFARHVRAAGAALPEFARQSGGAADLPMAGVTWAEAEAYCRWAGKRLPSEAEWEKAARGVDGRRYPWGEAWVWVRATSALVPPPERQRLIWRILHASRRSRPRHRTRRDPCADTPDTSFTHIMTPTTDTFDTYLTPVMTGITDTPDTSPSCSPSPARSCSRRPRPPRPRAGLRCACSICPTGRWT